MSISILNDIKKSLGGIQETDYAFDSELLLHINSALSALNQLGIGPKNGLYVTDASTTWDDVTSDVVAQGLVRQFVLASVKIGFDPPTSSFVLDSLREQRKELGFRLTVEHDRLEKDGIY